MTSDTLRLIKKDALGADPSPTPGMTRAHAITAEGLTSGTVSVGPGVMSGWHHHGTHETSIYVLEGTLHMEFAGGAFDAREGDFIHVPAGRGASRVEPRQRAESRGVLARGLGNGHRER